MSDWKWVFGLAIDEDVRWGLAQASPEGYSGAEGEFVIGTFGALPNDYIDVQKTLRRYLSSLRSQYSQLFARVEAIGVSTIGLAEHSTLRLTSIARKDWISVRKNRKETYIVDFKSLFRDLFPRIDGLKISIHNDATAKCLAEYEFNSDARASVLALVMFAEGVNAGIALNGWPIQGQLHCEMGHIWPRLLARDKFTPEHSGCPAHTYCFEGVASGARIRKSWGNELKDYGSHEDRPWEIIAYYVAQLCIDVTLTVFPNQILLSGNQLFPEILPFVYKYFDLFNTGGNSKPYLKYPAIEKLSKFIRMARLRDGNEGVYGALQLARQKAFPLRAA